jgi:hypothetical protein
MFITLFLITSAPAAAAQVQDPSVPKCLLELDTYTLSGKIFLTESCVVIQLILILLESVALGLQLQRFTALG